MRLALLVLLLAACTPGGGGGQQPTAESLFSASITKLVIEVDYQAGAEPYTGATGLAMHDVWQVTRDNLGRVFLESPKQLTLPTTLAEMQALSDVSGTSFDRDAILAIADRHRDRASTGDTASFYLVWLDGYFADESGTRNDVLGVSLGSTGVVGMFKPVIESSDGLLGGVSRYVEQSTIVHELGHAFGLIDNGLPLTSTHKDAAHGAHCTNEKCTMYWANEGTSSAVAFVKQAFTTGSTVIFGAECLADVDAAAQAR